MSRATIKNDLTPEAFQAGVMMYLGSFVRGQGIARERDFYNCRSIAEISPEDMPDEFSRALFQAMNFASSEGLEANPDNLVEVMFNHGLVALPEKDSKAVAAATDQAASLVQAYAKRGAKSLRDFRRFELVIHEMWRKRKLAEMPALIQKMNSQPQTTHETLLQLREMIDTMLGTSVTRVVTTEWDEQQKILEDLPAEKQSWIGKPILCLPPAWGLNSIITRLHKGDMTVLSGGTGDGKSAAAMQFAEWCVMCGRNVLVIHMEDSVETILMRQTVRWIPNTTVEELERGDPEKKMGQMLRLREAWLTAGGSLTYKYMAGFAPGPAISQIDEVARNLESQGKRLDVVVFDYFQKMDFDTVTAPGRSYVNEAQRAADRLKITAEAWALHMFVVSQETPDKNGDKHAMWSRALEHKCQNYISMTRDIIKSPDDEEKVTLDSQTIVVSRVGDRSVWAALQVKKCNRYRTGKVWVIMDGPRYRLMEPKFRLMCDRDPMKEFEIQVQRPATEEFMDKRDQLIRKYDQVYYDLVDPDSKKRGVSPAYHGTKQKDEEDTI